MLQVLPESILLHRKFAVSFAELVQDCYPLPEAHSSSSWWRYMAPDAGRLWAGPKLVVVARCGLTKFLFLC